MQAQFNSAFAQHVINDKGSILEVLTNSNLNHISISTGTL